MALKNCTIGTLDLSGAKLKDFDLRGTDFRTISGLDSLAGVVIDDYQLSLLAPLLAAIWASWWRNAARALRLTPLPRRVIFIERTVGKLALLSRR